MLFKNKTFFGHLLVEISMSDMPQIESTFFQDQSNLCQPMPNKRKKYAPYSKSDRITRRNEVFRLHIDYGYSARQISEIMKANRNTINNDIHFLYSKMELSYDNFENFFTKKMFAVETQRIRLREMLDDAKTINEKLSIEKLIHELDYKLITMKTKNITSDLSIHREAANQVNNWLERHGHKERVFSFEQLVTVSLGTAKKIINIVDDDFENESNTKCDVCTSQK